MQTIEGAPPAAQPLPTSAPSRRKRRYTPGGNAPKLIYLTLIGVLVFSALPLYYSLIVASHPNGVIAKTPPPFLPGDQLVSNIQRVLEAPEFGLTAILYSFLVAGTITASVVFFSTLAGFAFAKLRFRGSAFLLLVTVGTMMVPAQVGVVPLYMIMIKLEWIGQLEAIIVPALVNAFGVFFMTQYLKDALPGELLEAGRMDGCSSIRLFWHIVLPVARPAAAVLGMLTFLNAWNDYFWPNLILSGSEYQTVQTGLSALRSGRIEDYSLSLTGTLVATLPLLLMFVLLGKQLIGGIMQGAVKG